MRRVAAVLAVLLLTGLLLEGGARLALWALGPGEAPIRLGWDVGEGPAAPVRDLVYVPDPELFFRLRPNLDVAETENPRIFDLRTNSTGLRGDEVVEPKPPGRYRVLAVGDSCTFGSGAGQQQTWPAQLEAQLSALRPDLAVEVLNAGVPGFTSYQALRYLEIEGFALEPDAVVFGSGINDASPATAGGKRRFGAAHWLSDREYGEALRAQAGLGITRLLWRAGIRFGFLGDAGPELKRRVSLEDYRENLLRFAAESRLRGAVPVILVWPLETQLRRPPQRGELEATAERYQDEARRAAQEAGALLVDPAPALLGRGDLFVDLIHMNAEGYGRVAQAVAEGLRSRLPPAAGP